MKEFYKSLVKKMGFLIETHHYDLHERLDETNQRLTNIEKLLVKHYREEYKDDMFWTLTLLSCVKLPL